MDGKEKWSRDDPQGSPVLRDQKPETESRKKIEKEEPEK